MSAGIKSLAFAMSTSIKKNNSFNLYLSLYFLLSLAIAPIHLLNFDTYYYWDWSRHLDSSYYDGSPMIAYFIKLSTWLFGDTLFALSLVGVIVLGLTCLFIFKTSRLLMDEEASYISTLLFLFNPLVTLDLLNQTTYDTPLTLFWAMAIYFICKYLKSNKTSLLYAVGLCMGLMLLSKYTGVVLILGTLCYLIGSTHRTLFKSVHLYLAMLVALIAFSPVIYWNYLHDWQSFTYQLSTHQVTNTKSGMTNVIQSVFTTFLPFLNFMLIPLWNYHRLEKSKKSAPINYCFVISIIFLVFFLFKSSDTAIRYNWLTQFLISSSILGGYCYQELQIKKLTHLLVIGYAIASVGILLSNTTIFDPFHSKKMANYQALQQFNKQHNNLPETIIMPGWFEARMLFFLKDKPNVYTLDCGSAQNQYALWSLEMRNSIISGKTTDVLYLDNFDRGYCMKAYFKSCQALNTASNLLYAYHCSNG